MGELILVPNILADGPWQNVLPSRVYSEISRVSFFIVENIRTARRFIKMVNPDIVIDDITFFELNKHTDKMDLPGFLEPIKRGESTVLLSEAGCPGVADPGAEIVLLAHRMGVRIIPISGPSSIVMALMASGLNGQNFVFHGYLPIGKLDRRRMLERMEKIVLQNFQTQIFIETPYRNNQLLDDILTYCSSTTLLSISADISGENEFISTKPISEWRAATPDLHKIPAVFLLGASVIG